MKLPLSWLKEITPFSMTSEELADQLTMLGLEVDAIHRIAPPFEGVVVGEVLSTAPHPDADQLQIAQVSDGKETFQVVCGAPNCRPGIKTPFARVGARLGLQEEKPFKIKKSKIRGVESNGMLCSESELGLSAAHEGIAELPTSSKAGDDLAAQLGDEVLEISLTPNLGHCASALGVAREISAITRAPISLPAGVVREMGEANAVDLSIERPDLCPRYACRVIRHIKVGPSPRWLQERLAACGVRSINNVVDATNLVMFERGHPLHAFDGEKLSGGSIIVRSARAGERLTTLDGVDRPLDEGMLVICDQKGPVAIAGIMGGAASEVTESTTTVVIESAFFEPRQVMRTSRRLGLQTEGSRRFERTCDPNGVYTALDRVSAIIAELSSGQIAPGIVEQGRGDFPPRLIRLRLERVHAILGVQLSLGEVEEILGRLECGCTLLPDGALQVRVPTYRSDLSAEIDLIEEVARIYGYTNIDEPAPRFTVSLRPHSPLFLFQREVEGRLIGMGLQQTISCDLISPSQLDWLDERTLPRERCIEIVNPGSVDHSVLRPSLLPGMLATVGYNLHRQVRNLALFETGLGHFRTAKGYEEHALLGIVLTGERLPTHWSEKGRTADFFDLKGVVERLVEGLSIPGLRVEPSALANFHPGRQAALKIGELSVGVIGEIHPETLRRADLAQPLLFAELNLDDLLHLRVGLERALPPPLYPASERDWTVTLPEEVAVGGVVEQIEGCGSRLLKKVSLLAIYRSDQLGSDRKNATFRFVYRDEKKTLSDDRVEAEHARIIAKVSEVVG